MPFPIYDLQKQNQKDPTQLGNCDDDDDDDSNGQDDDDSRNKQRITGNSKRSYDGSNEDTLLETNILLSILSLGPKIYGNRGTS